MKTALILAAAVLLPAAALADPAGGVVSITVTQTPPSVPIPPRMAAIDACESGFRSNAQNPHSSASGEPQFTDGTWHDALAGLGYGQNWAHAKDAPVEIQRAAQIWLVAKRGTQPWACAGHAAPDHRTKKPAKHKAPAVLATVSVPHPLAAAPVVVQRPIVYQIGAGSVICWPGKPCVSIPRPAAQQPAPVSYAQPRPQPSPLGALAGILGAVAAFHHPQPAWRRR